MQSSNDILPQAANGHVKQIAIDLDVSLSRMYELLSRDNPYPKLRRILAAIARRNPDGLRLFQTDFNQWCADQLEGEQTHVTCAEAHKEFSEALQCWLEDKPPAQQRKELLEAKLVIEHRLDELNQL